MNNFLGKKAIIYTRLGLIFETRIIKTENITYVL